MSVEHKLTTSLWCTGVILTTCGDIPGSVLNFNNVCGAGFRPKVIIDAEGSGLRGWRTMGLISFPHHPPQDGHGRIKCGRYLSLPIAYLKSGYMMLRLF